MAGSSVSFHVYNLTEHKPIFIYNNRFAGVRELSIYFSGSTSFEILSENDIENFSDGFLEIDVNCPVHITGFNPRILNYDHNIWDKCLDELRENNEYINHIINIRNCKSCTLKSTDISNLDVIDITTKGTQKCYYNIINAVDTNVYIQGGFTTPSDNIFDVFVKSDKSKIYVESGNNQIFLNYSYLNGTPTNVSTCFDIKNNSTLSLMNSALLNGRYNNKDNNNWKDYFTYIEAYYGNGDSGKLFSIEELNEFELEELSIVYAKKPLNSNSEPNTCFIDYDQGSNIVFTYDDEYPYEDECLYFLTKTEETILDIKRQLCVNSRVKKLEFNSQLLPNYIQVLDNERNEDYIVYCMPVGDTSHMNFPAIGSIRRTFPNDSKFNTNSRTGTITNPFMTIDEALLSIPYVSTKYKNVIINVLPVESSGTRMYVSENGVLPLYTDNGYKQIKTLTIPNIPWAQSITINNIYFLYFYMEDDDQYTPISIESTCCPVTLNFATDIAPVIYVDINSKYRQSSVFNMAIITHPIININSGVKVNINGNNVNIYVNSHREPDTGPSAGTNNRTIRFNNVINADALSHTTINALNIVTPKVFHQENSIYNYMNFLGPYNDDGNNSANNITFNNGITCNEGAIMHIRGSNINNVNYCYNIDSGIIFDNNDNTTEYNTALCSTTTTVPKIIGFN